MRGLLISYIYISGVGCLRKFLKMEKHTYSKEGLGVPEPGKKKFSSIGICLTLPQDRFRNKNAVKLIKNGYF